MIPFSVYKIGKRTDYVTCFDAENDEKGNICEKSYI